MGNNPSRNSRDKESIESAFKSEIWLTETSRSLLKIENLPNGEIKTGCFQPESLPNQNCPTFHFISKPIKESGDNFKKFPNELRERIEITNKFPNSVHGLLKITLEGGHITATGILIGPDLVLTAAHNVFDVKNKKFYEMSFFPGKSDDYAPFQKIKVLESYCPKEFMKTGKEDYALLVLEETIGTKTGYFGLHIANGDTLKGKELFVVGYPGYVRNKITNELINLFEQGRHQQWGMSGKEWFFEREGDSIDFISYPDILTTPGQSGSGLYYKSDEGNYYVIGVHVLGDIEINSATFLSERRFQQIQEWISLSRAKTIEKCIGNVNLNLGSREMSLKAANLLVSLSTTSPLQQLSLFSCSIDSGMMVALRKSQFKALTYIDLAGNKLGNAGTSELGKNTSWPKLKTLILRSNEIGDQGAKGLAENESWTALEYLSLEINKIGGFGAICLGTNTSWVALQTLHLHENLIDDSGAAGLGANCSWKNLDSLNLEKNRISDRGAAELGKNEAWTRLRLLYLIQNFITDKGVAEFSKNTSWSELRHLSLGLNPFGNKGITELEKNKTWKKLVTRHIIEDGKVLVEVIKRRQVEYEYINLDP